MNYDILLNCLPPFRVQSPSAALSILKSFLEEREINVKIKYWNIGFDKYFSKYLNSKDSIMEEVIISTFLNCGLITDNDTIIKNKSLLFEYRKDLYVSLSEFENIFNNLTKDIKNYISKELNNDIFKSIKIFGLSFKYNQWIPGLIISKMVKQNYPDIKIVIGGIDNRETGILLLKNWDCFDFAIWGEGEYPLLQLYHQLSNNEIIENVPQLIYRRGKNAFSNNKLSKDSGFSNYNYPVYDDYFEQIRLYNLNNILVELPINAIRGCNWNRCKFCVSRKGYVYKERTSDDVALEIEGLIKKHNITNFMFVDNCTYKNVKDLEILCESLIKLNNSTNQYLKIGITLNHAGISRKLIDKLYLAGIRRMQVGFESFSNNLLQLMGKENTLCDNILFVKLALRYNISLPLLIINDILSETISDIMESINNLHFFRFYFNNSNFQLSHTPLKIQNGSQFYKQLTLDELKLYKYNNTVHILSDEVKKLDVDKLLFSYYKANENTIEWRKFQNILNGYKENKFTFNLIQNEQTLFYYEYYNGKEIETIEFDDPCYIEILKLTNDKICSLDTICSEMTNKNPNIDKDYIFEIIKNLRAIYLIYHNIDLSQIVSCIFID